MFVSSSSAAYTPVLNSTANAEAWLSITSRVVRLVTGVPSGR
ncbi:hypothetical protein ACFYZ8_26685 [Streptomyces sp. NPDC001668]